MEVVEHKNFNAVLSGIFSSSKLIRVEIEESSDDDDDAVDDKKLETRNEESDNVTKEEHEIGDSEEQSSPNDYLTDTMEIFGWRRNTGKRAIKNETSTKSNDLSYQKKLRNHLVPTSYECGIFNIVNSDITLDVLDYPKPLLSYSSLIALALFSSTSGQLYVKQMYTFIKNNFPYFLTGTIWKNSMRHSLSHNRFFRKVMVGNSKFSMWTVNPLSREQLKKQIKSQFFRNRTVNLKSMANPAFLKHLIEGDIPSKEVLTADNIEEPEMNQSNNEYIVFSWHPGDEIETDEVENYTSD